MTSKLANSDHGICDVLIAEYLQAIARQENPSREELIRKYPDLASALRARFIEMDMAGTVACPPTTLAPGSTAVLKDPLANTILGGRYELLESIGEGGMGSVWLAEQQIPVKRKVAIKLIKAGMDSKQMLARFEAERQALAVMDHPNIAKVFDGGLTERGRPYFVMEYAHGVPFTAYCDQQRLSLNARLRLFIHVCEAVQHAHYKGIVHRDLKPSNILICTHQDQPVPKVIDFGVAKAMHQPLTENSIHTHHGALIGTPLYMSPEQAAPGILDIDTRADIYSLGVVLYELLTATTPLERPQLQKASLHEIVRLIREEEPIRPSIRLKSSVQLAAVAANRSIEPKRLYRSLAGDLDWIVIKSLEKDRSRRYETANGLARDLERFLDGEPVEACPPTVMYRLRKFISRHRGQVIAAGLAVTALIVGIVGTSWGMVRAEYYRNEAVQALVKEQEHKRRAEESEILTLANFRESTDDVIEHLIGARKHLGPTERAYLERSLVR
jgi:serine/threonine protein kinase